MAFALLGFWSMYFVTQNIINSGLGSRLVVSGGSQYLWRHWCCLRILRLESLISFAVTLCGAGINKVSERLCMRFLCCDSCFVQYGRCCFFGRRFSSHCDYDKWNNKLSRLSVTCISSLRIDLSGISSGVGIDCKKVSWWRGVRKLAVSNLKSQYKNIELRFDVLKCLAVIFTGMILSWSFVPQNMILPEIIAILGYAATMTLCAIKNVRIVQTMDLKSVLTIASFLFFAYVMVR